MKAQNGECQRNKKQRCDSVNSSDTFVLTAAPFKIWDTLMQFHPHKKEILNMVRILNSLGANHNIIAATLGLQSWKTFYESCEWVEKDVKALVEGYGA